MLASVALKMAVPQGLHRERHHDSLEVLREQIEQAAGLLPAQGPITAFAFVNTLQALEGLPYDEAIQLGSRLYNCQPYLDEEVYRRELAHGRIRCDDLVEVLLEDLGDRADGLVGCLGTRFHLRLAMLEHPLRLAPTAELRWVITESDALLQFRPEVLPQKRQTIVNETRQWLSELQARDFAGAPARVSALVKPLLSRFQYERVDDWTDEAWEEFCLNLLWLVCRHGMHAIPPEPDHRLPSLRPRDWLLDLTGEDADLRVHELLIRFCAAYLDQGQADWPLPGGSQRLWEAFIQLNSRSSLLQPRWLRALPAELKQIQAAGVQSLQVIQEELRHLQISADEQPEFLVQSLLALRGWSGMIWQMETRPDRVPFPVETGTLTEFLALRLILDRLAATDIATNWLGHARPLSQLRRHATERDPAHHGLDLEQRAFLAFQLAQVRGWLPHDLLEMTKPHWGELARELESFSGVDRRRIYHAAYERTYQVSALDAVAVVGRRKLPVTGRPSYQTVFCLDAREESMRRHLEDVEPNLETFGTAGFYNIPIQYRGAADAHYATLCPIVVRPQHWIVEEVAFTEEETHRRRALARRALGAATRQFQVGSRSFAGGALLSAGLGVLASIPMVMSVLFPRLTSRLQSSASRLIAAPRLTRLRLQRTADDPGPNNGHVGFSLDEMVAMGERALRDIGLTKKFSRLVVFFGHGSECLNNPHKSAYDCGACSGNPGGPNARALASILNDARIRTRLAQRGLDIPDDTAFVGALHNTCNDTVEYFDLDLLPTTHLSDFRAFKSVMEQACARNAQERCRRFAAAPRKLSREQAVRLVRQRAEDLAETRPEYGNSTNALCLVGRRARIRGLFLDRRSFLMSYDPSQENADHSILERILSAVVPVCSGINLQYTLSRIDSGGWGCGTKLPHNVTSLLGVMDGAASDLRPGLPWQGVDIHEPMRLTFVIESTPAALETIMQRNEVIRRILGNSWAHLALLDPESEQLLVYRRGRFQPYQPRATHLPTVTEWTEWFAGCSDNLGFAMQAKFAEVSAS